MVFLLSCTKSKEIHERNAGLDHSFPHSWRVNPVRKKSWNISQCKSGVNKFQTWQTHLFHSLWSMCRWYSWQSYILNASLSLKNFNFKPRFTRSVQQKFNNFLHKLSFFTSLGFYTENLNYLFILEVTVRLLPRRYHSWCTWRLHCKNNSLSNSMTLLQKCNFNNRKQKKTCLYILFILMKNNCYLHYPLVR